MKTSEGERRRNQHQRPDGLLAPGENEGEAAEDEEEQRETVATRRTGFGAGGSALLHEVAMTHLNDPVSQMLRCTYSINQIKYAKVMLIFLCCSNTQK